jgi:hypothetical protein
MRIQPNMRVDEYQTFSITAPKSTHFRPATCEEVDCPHYLGGWKSSIDETTELGQAQARYIRTQSGKAFREYRVPGLTVFEFEPGQTCFGSSKHTKRLDRPEIFAVRGGDWRGNPRGNRRIHANADDWRDDFAEHQDKIKTILERG